MILSWKEAKMEIQNGGTVWIVKSRWERQWTVTKRSREKQKSLKTAPVFPKHAIFANETSRQKIARSSHQNTQGQKFEKKISKCFSQLEGLPASESQAEPQKSLSKSRDWTFHSRTSRQKWPTKTRLRLATWHTRDWAAKTGQDRIFEIFRFFKQNTFQKHLKHSKIFLCLN